MRNRKVWIGVGFFSMLCLVLATGCRSLPHCPDLAGAKNPKLDPNLKVNYVIEVNNEGFLLNLQPGQKRRPITSRQELARYLNATIFREFQKSGKQKLLVFVHGGLNDRQQGMQHFSDDFRNITNSAYYPVFIVWPSGWGPTYLEHLLWVRQGLKAETTGEKTFTLLTSPFMLLADLGRAITRLPLVIANNSMSDLETIKPARYKEGGAAVRQYQDLVHTNFQVAIGDDYSLGSDRTLRGVTYWLTLPVKYVLSSFIDGFGKGAWDNMLRRTQQTYPARLDNNVVRYMQRMSRTNTDSPEIQPAAITRWSLSRRQEKLRQRYSAAGLPMFIESLHRYQTNHPSLEVTLVGHSMGTIILNRVLRDAAMEFTNIVYMAAACSISDFSTSVLPYMKQHTNAQFFNLCLHPVAEAGEWQAAMLDLPPRGSLLVWIDNFLQNPVTEQERTFGRWRNLFRSGTTGEPIIRQFYDHDGDTHLKERLHFQAFSVGFGDKDQLRKTKYQWNEDPVLRDAKERCNNPLSHGEFTEMPYWDPHFWWQPVTVAGGKEHQVTPAK